LPEGNKRSRQRWDDMNSDYWEKAVFAKTKMGWFGQLNFNVFVKQLPKAYQ
jgi:hypothetical protein